MAARRPNPATLSGVKALIVPLALGLGLTVAGGCKSSDGDYNGIGTWVLLETELSEAEGACTPGEITFCSHAGSVNLGGKPATVNLYFKGTKPDAKLVEIELQSRACDTTRVANTLAQRLGKPTARADKRLFWEGKRAFVAAALPGRAARCTVHFVTPQDSKRITELRAE